VASFLSAVDTFRVLVPRSERLENYPTLPESNFIDKHVNQKLRKLNLLPSDIADDAEYLRARRWATSAPTPTTNGSAMRWGQTSRSISSRARS
jgi:hypothetical protein